MLSTLQFDLCKQPFGPNIFNTFVKMIPLCWNNLVDIDSWATGFTVESELFGTNTSELIMGF